MLSNCTMHYGSVFEIYLENLYQSHFKTNQINKVQSIGKSGVRAHMTVTGPKLFVPFKMLLFSRYMYFKVGLLRKTKCFLIDFIEFILNFQELSHVSGNDFPFMMCAWVNTCMFLLEYE